MTPKQKAKKRRKANLKNPNSPTWRDKADDMYSDVIRQVGKCEICGTEGRPRQKDGLLVVGLHSHHLILRGRLRFRFDLSNGVCLCVACHGAHPNFRNKKRCAHGSDEARDAFWQWLKTERNGQWLWYEENKENKRMPDKTYQQCYAELLEIFSGRAV